MHDPKKIMLQSILILYDLYCSQEEYFFSIGALGIREHAIYETKNTVFYRFIKNFNVLFYEVLNYLIILFYRSSNIDLN